jgi:hypothetical protein
VFDILGMEALLAILADRESTRDRLRAWLNWIALPVGVGGIVILLGIAYYHGRP